MFYPLGKAGQPSCLHLYCIFAIVLNHGPQVSELSDLHCTSMSTATRVVQDLGLKVMTCTCIVMKI